MARSQHEGDRQEIESVFRTNFISSHFLEYHQAASLLGDSFLLNADALKHSMRAADKDDD